MVRFWLVWVWSFSHNFSICCTLVQTYQKAIVVVIKSGVEVSEENGSESILVESIWNWLYTNEAILLPLETIQVALWLDLNFGVMKHKFQRIEFLGQNVTGETADKYLITIDFPCFDGAILSHHVLFKLLEFGIWHLNRSISRVNKCHFSSDTALNILVSIENIAH